MDYLSHNIAVNLKRIRTSKGMSLDVAAEQTGVSKSMLAQIERGEGNPTLSTLWKISNGMKVPFDALTVRPKSPYEIVRKSEIQPLLEDDGKVKNYPLLPEVCRLLSGTGRGKLLGIGTAFEGNRRIYHGSRRPD